MVVVENLPPLQPNTAAIIKQQQQQKQRQSHHHQQKQQQQYGNRRICSAIHSLYAVETAKRAVIAQNTVEKECKSGVGSLLHKHKHTHTLARMVVLYCIVVKRK